MAERFEFFAQGGQRVAVARRSGIGWNIESRGDLVERELLPNLKNKDFTLHRRQMLHGGFNLAAALGIIARLRLEEGVALFESPVGFLLPLNPARVSPDEIQRGSTH